MEAIITLNFKTKDPDDDLDIIGLKEAIAMRLEDIMHAPYMDVKIELKGDSTNGKL